MPSGFEKLLKKSKKGSTKKDEKESSKDQEEPTEDQEEGSFYKKGGDKKDKSDSNESDWKKNLKSQFFEPNGGGPKWESWFLLSCIGATGAYYLKSISGQSQEIQYQELVQNYLQNNEIKVICLQEDKTGSTFKYRAVIELNSGVKKHLVLP